MITIERTVDISPDKHLHLDLTLPKTVPSGKTSVVLVFSAETPAPGARETPPPYTPEPFPTLEELKAQASRKAAERRAEIERTGVDPLARFAGRLKDVFPEDGMEYQRRMRDEWPD
jgi:hypothetical protein